MNRVIARGSDGSAAGGRVSDLSEWQRSAAEEVVLSTTKMPGTATGCAGPWKSPSSNAPVGATIGRPHLALPLGELARHKPYLRGA